MSNTADSHSRIDVLGVGVSATNIDSAVDTIDSWIAEQRHEYVCVTGVHGVMESQSDPELLKIHNHSGMTVPDGVPMVWCGHRAGASWMQQVRGADLMLAVLERAEQKGWSSYFYGGNDGVPDKLIASLRKRFPNLKVAGWYSPPFRPLTPAEDAQVCNTINESGAQLVWIGLSTPKQERWAAAHVGRLDANALLAVGAAFDFHAGLVSQSPKWMSKYGLEWAYRVYKEPRRLWKRYAKNNPRFVANIIRRRPRLVIDLHEGPK